MSPSNRTADRLTALERSVAAGKLAPEAATAERKRLEKLGARWEARWTLPDGRTERTKTFKTKTAAAAYEAEQRAQVRKREHQDPQYIRATLAALLDFYLAERMHFEGKAKASIKNARAHRKNVLKVWGPRFTLESLDLDPEKHCKELRAGLERFLSKKTAWNNKVTARAAVAYWIRRRRLRILNPFDAYDWPKPDTRRKERISEETHLALLRGCRALPAWVPVFLEMGWETGWRSGEIQDWQIERLHLEPAGEHYPWVRTLVEKKGAAEPIYEDKPISFRAGAILRAYLGNRTAGAVWPLKRCQHDRYIHRAFTAAGAAGNRFHDYRRSFKTRGEAAGVPSVAMADYAGHSEEMSEGYNIRQRFEREAVLRRMENS